MEVRSISKYVRISPFKAREVSRCIQGLPVGQALDMLAFTPRKAAALLEKTLKSAIANAENNHDLDIEKLVVKEATVGAGPSFRRFKPRARGSASPIRKRTSHLRIILSDEIEIPERKTSGKKKSKAKAKPAGAAPASTKKAEPKVKKEVAPPADEPASTAAKSPEASTEAESSKENS